MSVVHTRPAISGRAARGVVTVVGRRDASTRKLEAALAPLCVEFQYLEPPPTNPAPMADARSIQSAAKAIRLFKQRRHLYRGADRLARREVDLRAYFAHFATLTELAPSIHRLLYVVHFPSLWARRSAVAAQRRTLLQVVEMLQSSTPDTPIVATAAPAATTELVDEALDAGADEVLREADLAVETLVFRRISRLLQSFQGAGVVPSPTRAESEMPAASATSAETTGVVADGETLSSEPVEQRVLQEAPPLTQAERERAVEELDAALSRLPDQASRAAWWASVKAIPAPDLRNASYRLDSRKVADRLGVEVAELRYLATPPMSRPGIKKSPDSERLQVGLAAVARVIDALNVLIPDETAQRQWLRTPNPRLADQTPLHLLLNGEGMRVAALLGALREGVVD